MAGTGGAESRQAPRQTNPIFRVFGSKTRVRLENKANLAVETVAAGRWGLAGMAPVAMWTKRETNPIGRAGPGKSEIRNPKQVQNPNVQNPIADDVSAAPNKANLALLATSGAALAGPRGARYEIRFTRYAGLAVRAPDVDRMRNKASDPICGGSVSMEHYISKASPASEKQSQSMRPGLSQLGIGDLGLGIRRDGHSSDVDATQNKPNLPLLATSRALLVGPAGGDWGFEGDTCEIRDTRKSCGQNAKQSQFATFLAQKRRAS
jgi:hypothetical protein